MAETGTGYNPQIADKKIVSKSLFIWQSATFILLILFLSLWFSKTKFVVDNYSIILIIGGIITAYVIWFWRTQKSMGDLNDVAKEIAIKFKQKGLGTLNYLNIEGESFNPRDMEVTFKDQAKTIRYTNNEIKAIKNINSYDSELIKEKGRQYDALSLYMSRIKNLSREGYDVVDE